VALLDRDVKRELRSLPSGLAETVGKHLLMCGRLVDSDPAAAVAHAKKACELASRVACVRETYAIAAYANQDFQVALREARTYRRMTGAQSFLPMMADCERGLGRPERALEVIAEVDLQTLPVETRAEALIVAAGARQDLGQTDAALALLDSELLRSKQRSSWLARLRMAYAELLSAAKRPEEARRWMRAAEAADPDGSTVFPERLAQSVDIEFEEVLEEEVPEMEAPEDPETGVSEPPLPPQDPPVSER
jgi:tetratricopeptide (TPR) repeat protein